MPEKYNFKTAIKWSGVKGKQAPVIIKYFKREIKTYYEPFAGSCAVLYHLMKSKNHVVNHFVISDLNKDLIDTWLEIKNKPQEMFHYYGELYKRYMELDWGERKYFYRNIRNRFNLEKSPYDFFFIMRTAVNGMPRYNKRGEFNTSNQLKQNPVSPKNLLPIITDWSNLLNAHNVEIIHSDYRKITSRKEDVVYLDPPYTGSKGMYYGTIDYTEFFDWITSKNEGSIFLSFDGYIEKFKETIVPQNIFNKRIEIENGNSSFRRQKMSENGIVKEFLFFNE